MKIKSLLTKNCDSISDSIQKILVDTIFKEKCLLKWVLYPSKLYCFFLTLGSAGIHYECLSIVQLVNYSIN